MAPRANWKGFLQFAAVTCPVALYTASSTSDRIVLNAVNRSTGHRVRREFVDSGTGEAVEKDDQVKGYETDKDQYVLLEPDEIAEAQAKSDKSLAVSAFIDIADVDEVFFDKPYYLRPADRSGVEIFSILRDGLRRREVTAVAQAVLFRRLRTLLIRAYDDGMIATTLKFDYEVRAAREVFADVPPLQIKDEMLELAEHIINTKRGDFEPAQFIDRYEAALAKLVKAKLEGRAIVAPKKQPASNTVDLMQALRDSAGVGGKGQRRAKPVKTTTPPAPLRGTQNSRGRRRKAS